LAESLFLDYLTMPKAVKTGAQIQSIPLEVGQYIHEEAMKFYKEKAKEDKAVAQYIEYYEEFFEKQGYDKYIKFIDDLI
jgi:coproporphyrinogen III oxidase-like Fe-S oxidoreductase